MQERFQTLAKPHPVVLFVVMFVVSLLVQHITWDRSFPFDGVYWIEAGSMMTEGKLIPPEHFVYGYPGTTVIGLAAGLLSLGIDGELALRLSMSLIFALFSAGVVLLAYLLRPHLAWWPLLAWALLLQHTTYFATPPSSVLGPMLTLFVLLVMYAVERKQTSLPFLALIGATAGIACATRLDIGGVITATGILTLALMTRSVRVFILAALIGLFFFTALTPFMWHDAFGYLYATLEKIFAHAGNETHGGALRAMFVASMFGTFSFFFLFISVFLKLPLSLSKGLFLWVTGAWSLLVVLLFFSEHHPAWIFYPVLVPLELLFPLFVAVSLPTICARLKIPLPVATAFLIGVYLTQYAVRYQLFTH